MQEITVRQSRKKDIDQIAALCVQLGYDYPADKIRKKFRKIRKSKDNEIFVACDSGKVIGWIHISIYNLLYFQKLGNILGLITDRGYRGRGIGKNLMSSAEQWAKDKGCAGIIVNSGETRKDTHTFYEKIGYRLIKRQERYYKDVK